MTQNVKKPRPSPAAHRLLRRLLPLATLTLLALGALLAVAGCSTACTGDDCAGSAEGGSATGPDPGRFSKCQVESDCDEAHGFSCVDGTCSYACRSHADCIEVGHCDSLLVDGERQNYCVADDAAPEPGKLYTSCPLGDECADPALCVGAGPGDLDAYCSIDCSRDDDCAAGYYCGSITRPPCDDACTFKGQPKEPRCVPADQIGDDQPYQCSTLGIVRRVCRQREFCSPCESDADCLAVPNQICARDESGEKICTRRCDTGARSCPWGHAARCGFFDDDLGVPTCSHRFGSCHGAGGTCEPCRSEQDCPGGACASSQFTGERWCVDFSTRCECQDGVGASGTCDGGCPESPSGLSVMCIGDERSSLFNLCYAANSGTDTLLGSSSQTGCWDASP